MHPIVNIAVQAARSAGNTINRSIHKLDTLKISNKGHNDFVTEVDQRAEQAIIHTIHKAYPDHAILAEESGQQEGREDGSDFQWIIDPLDGTTNYLHGFPQYAVSIAVKHKGRLEHGVIYDPLKDELFTASRGQGALLNNRRLRVTPRKSLEGALLGTGFPYTDHRNLDLYLGMLGALIRKTAGVRRAGSAALDLAYVAAGRLDGFWELNLKPWDLAAGILMIQEAGGISADIDGGHTVLETGNVVAGNPKIFKAILQEIAPYCKNLE